MYLDNQRLNVKIVKRRILADIRFVGEAMLTIHSANTAQIG